MRRLLRKRGSVLLITLLYMVVMIFGMMTLPLVAALKQKRQARADVLYNEYTNMSYIKVMSAELVNTLAEARTELQYSPLLSSMAMQEKLQEALYSYFIAADGTWGYHTLLPTTVGRAPTATVRIEGMRILADDTLDLKQPHVLEYPQITAVISIDGLSREIHLEGLKLIYGFERNKVFCKFDISDVKEV